MKIHTLKTDPIVFQDVVLGHKNFEIRKNDRGFELNDTLHLKETSNTGEQISGGQPAVYTGRECYLKVMYILSGPIYGLAEGWVIMSVQAIEETR